MKLNPLVQFELVDSQENDIILNGQQLQDVIGRMYIQGFIRSLPEVLLAIDKLVMNDMILIEDAETTIRRCFSIV